jgi:hypothetical protein
MVWLRNSVWRGSYSAATKASRSHFFSYCLHNPRRYCTPYLFSVIKLGSPTPVEKRKVIQVMKGKRVIRKLSADDIARLPQEADSYRTLRIER